MHDFISGAFADLLHPVVDDTFIKVTATKMFNGDITFKTIDSYGVAYNLSITCRPTWTATFNIGIAICSVIIVL
jgi:hypothetical protein